MTARSGPSRVPLLMALLCLTLLLRAAVPAGWMPGQASDGSITLQICGEGSGISRAVTIPVKRDAPAPQKAEKEQCPFASLAQPLLPPSSPMIDARLATADARETLPPETTRPAGLRGAWPPSTGPPLLS